MIRFFLAVLLPASWLMATDIPAEELALHMNKKIDEASKFYKVEEIKLANLQAELKKMGPVTRRSCAFFNWGSSAEDQKKRTSLKRQLRHSKNRLSMYDAEIKHFQMELTKLRAFLATQEDRELLKKLATDNQRLTKTVQDMSMILQVSLGGINAKINHVEQEFVDGRLGEIASRMDDIKSVIDYNDLDSGHNFEQSRPECKELFDVINNTLSISMEGYFVLASSKIAFATDKTSQAAHLVGTAVGFIPGAGALGSVAECGIVVGKGHLRRQRTYRAAAFFGNSQDMHVIVKKAALKIARDYCSAPVAENIDEVRKLGKTIPKELQRGITAGKVQDKVHADQQTKVDALFELWRSKKVSELTQ